VSIETTAAEIAFAHRHAAHCESGVVASLLRHHGLELSEPMVFGLASALSFAYLPFIRINGLPLISYRMPPRFILRGVQRALGWRFRLETFRSPQAGQARLEALLGAGQPVGLQTSVFWLPYFPEDMRFHFNAHNVVAVGFRDGDYRISDPVFENLVTCSASDLLRARFARGVLAPKGLLYYPVHANTDPDLAGACRKAILRTTRAMLYAPLPLIGVRGIRTLARRVASLDKSSDRDYALRYIGHIVRMQEEIGTGGAGFRFLFASFLQEAAQRMGRPALAECAAQATAVGDEWREFALQCARMVRGRDAFDAKRLRTLLDALSLRETQLYTNLRKAL
jgi:hypothetical protein